MIGGRASVPVATITITRTLHPDGDDLVTVDTRDEAGEVGVPQVVALGMLRMAEWLLLCEDDA